MSSTTLRGRSECKDGSPHLPGFGLPKGDYHREHRPFLGKDRNSESAEKALRPLGAAGFDQRRGSKSSSVLLDEAKALGSGSFQSHMLLAGSIEAGAQSASRPLHLNWWAEYGMALSNKIYRQAGH
jgi:hypothetical protein